MPALRSPRSTAARAALWLAGVVFASLACRDISAPNALSNRAFLLHAVTRGDTVYATPAVVPLRSLGDSLHVLAGSLVLGDGQRWEREIVEVAVRADGTRGMLLAGRARGVYAVIDQADGRTTIDLFPNEYFIQDPGRLVVVTRDSAYVPLFGFVFVRAAGPEGVSAGRARLVSDRPSGTR